MAFALSYAAALATIVGVAALTGQLLESFLRLPRTTRGPLRSIGLGLTVWMYLVFALAALQLLSARSLWVAISAAVLLGAPLLVYRRKKLAQPEPRPVLEPRPLVAWLPAAVAAAGFVALFLGTLSPEIGWDDNAYHLTVPRIWSEHGGFRRIPYNVYSNWPMNVDLLFGLALILRDQVLAKLVHTAMLALLMAQVASLAGRYGRRELAWLAALPLLASPVIHFEAQVAYIELALAFFFALSLEQVLDALETKNPTAILLGGVFAGVLAGSKVSGGIYALGLLAVLAGSLALQRARPRALLRACFTFGVPVLLLAAPWFLKTWVLTGNPLYPFAWRTFGGPEWSAELQASFVQWQQSIGRGRTLSDYLWLPWRVTQEAGSGYRNFSERIGPYWLGLLGLALVGAWRDAVVRRCLAAVGAGFWLWALSSQQARFLIPLLGPLSLACVLTLGRMVDRARAQGAAVALTFAFVLSVDGLWPRFAFAAPSVPDRAAWLASPTRGLYRFIHETTPPTAKVMMINWNQGFFLRREFIADSFFEASQLSATFKDARSTDDVAAILERLGVTHILWQRSDWGVHYPQALLDFLATAPSLHDDGSGSLHAVP